MASLPLSNKISQASSANKDQRFIISQYGDGYEQRAAIGINSMFMTWDIQWNMLSLEERNTLMSFFNAHGRVKSFDWTPPNEPAGKYIFNTSISEGNVGIRYNINVQLRQVFE